MLCGSVSLIYPFGRDQGAYAYAGWVMLEGGAPYRDVFIFKPPMTAVVHGLAIGLFGVNTWAIRVLDLGWTAATSLVVAAIALELWNRRDAALAAGLLCPFLYYQIDYWMIAQTDGWMTLPCAAAMWAVLRGGRALGQSKRGATAWWVAAGMLAGAALLFKYTAVTIGIPMLAALGWVVGARGRGAWLGVPAMIFGGALTLSTCAVWLLCAEAWGPFVDSQLNLLPSYVERRSDGNTATRALARLVTLKRTKLDLIPLFWAAPAALVPALFSTRESGRKSRLALGVVVIWWLAAVANVVVQGKFFDYHYLPILAPAALIAGLGIAVVLEWPLSWLHGRHFQAQGVAALLVLLIAVTPLGGRARELGRVAFGGQTIEEYIGSRREYALPSYNVGEIRRVANVLQQTTVPEQRVFLWGYEPTINVRAQRHTVSRFLYNFPFRVSWGDPEYEAELMQALRARPPHVFVVSSGDRFPGITGTYKDSAALLREFDELNALVKERYELAETVGRYSIWRLEE
jgi:4-amino-4-deoxy-L-arabinose transferase-like glycosyltransferase